MMRRKIFSTVTSVKDIEHPSIIRTDRLILRQWNQNDLELFANMNADPRVMEYFPSLQLREESDHLVPCVSNHIETFGWGLWATSLAETGEFIGFIGLEDVYFEANFVPAVENTGSRAVMQKIGMHHDSKDDFKHPKLPKGHLLRRHVLYRLGRSEWKKLQRAP